jgi:AcrR family transcriptional regulator
MNETMLDRSIMQGAASDDGGLVPLTPVRAARREKVLAAAEALFASQGFRGTTIEAIAEAAGMSKVTVYGYFRDKDAVFVAVAERLAAHLEAAVHAKLTGDLVFPANVAAALAAKQVMVFDLVRRSAFSGELFQAKDMHVLRLFEALDARIIALLAVALVDGGSELELAKHTANLLFAATEGIAAHASTASQLVEQIALIVDALMAWQERSIAS